MYGEGVVSNGLWTVIFPIIASESN